MKQKQAKHLCFNSYIYYSCTKCFIALKWFIILHVVVARFPTNYSFPDLSIALLYLILITIWGYGCSSSHLTYHKIVTLAPLQVPYFNNFSTFHQTSTTFITCLILDKVSGPFLMCSILDLLIYLNVGNYYLYPPGPHIDQINDLNNLRGNPSDW